MCGMTGWLSFGDNLQSQYDTLLRMTKTMARRGPDGEGIWIDGPIALGHRRLSVIDVENGKQPMIGHDTRGNVRAVISYVGEVYNYRELRQTLIQKGYKFNTKSDTEVVLKAYIEWGESFVERLNGMYGFALWDINQQKLLLIRDRMGVKPLYYYPTSKGIIFGSEPKAIIANPIVPRRLDADGLRELLELVKTPGQAIFAGIHEVQPGEYITIDIKGIRKTRYWSLEAKPHTDDLDTTIAYTRSLLEDIVAREMVTDVPLSVLLSGGLDSSTITALAQRHLNTSGSESRIKTFSLDFKAHGADFVSDGFRVTPDTPFVKDLVDWVDTDHHQILLDSQELADPLLHQHVVQALDMPPAYWGDLYPSLYRLFEEVRRQSTVVLSGEAADEVFGGYRWFHDPAAIPEATFPWLTSATAKLFDGKGMFQESVMKRLDMPSFVHDSYLTALNAVPRLPGESPTNARMREITHIHLTRYVQTLLDRKDRMSMAVGLEVRVPFCDHRLVEYAFNIPWEMKAFDGREKSILRAAAQDVLPPSILKRIKNPYPATQDPAYEIALRRRMAHIIEDRHSPVLELINPTKVSEILSSATGDYSPLQNRMGMERVIGIDSWLREYDVDIDLH